MLYPPFTLRLATAADARAICEMHIASIRAYCAAVYTPKQINSWADPKRPEHYVAALSAGEAMFVVESDHHILGFAAIAGREIKAVYVAAGHARRGIGRALLQAVEEHAALSGLAELRLESTL